jgi:hypothetical protein
MPEDIWLKVYLVRHQVLKELLLMENQFVDQLFYKFLMEQGKSKYVTGGTRLQYIF